MKIGWIRRIYRRAERPSGRHAHRPHGPDAGLWLAMAACCVLTGALTSHDLAAQTAPELSLLRALGDHYGLPADEVEILAEWRIPVSEIPVALAVARNAGISPDALVASRRNGRNWAALAGRYGLDMSFFHVRLDPVPAVLASLYGELEGRPRARWGEVVPSDAQVAFLIHVRFLQEYVGVPPSEAAAALVQHGGPAEALRAISP